MVKRFKISLGFPDMKEFTCRWKITPEKKSPDGERRGVKTKPPKEKSPLRRRQGSIWSDECRGRAAQGSDLREVLGPNSGLRQICGERERHRTGRQMNEELFCSSVVKAPPTSRVGWVLADPRASSKSLIDPWLQNLAPQPSPDWQAEGRAWESCGFDAPLSTMAAPLLFRGQS